MPTLYHWNTRERGLNLAVYINRHDLNGPGRDNLHYHDFAELLYAREGDILHTINGVKRIFHAGELVFIRPQYRHQMRLAKGAHFVYDVIGFPPDVLRRLQAEYPQEFSDFWDLDAPQPQTLVLTPAQRQWTTEMVRELAANASSHFLFNRFLLNLAYEIARRPPAPDENAPLWLVQALHELSDIKLCCQGPRVLADLTGRSFEHVSRVLKKTCGLTPSQAVNRARIEYAASQLVLSEADILAVALECGFQSLGHFYQEFQRQYGLTPRQYRLQNRQATGYSPRRFSA